MISGENGRNWSIFDFSTTPLRLGGPETPPENLMLRLGEPLCLDVAFLRLGQATVLVLFFLQLFLESVTLLFGLSIKDN